MCVGIKDSTLGLPIIYFLVGLKCSPYNGINRPYAGGAENLCLFCFRLQKLKSNQINKTTIAMFYYIRTCICLPFQNYFLFVFAMCVNLPRLHVIAYLITIVKGQGSEGLGSEGLVNDHLFGKELFILFAASAFRKLSSIYVFSYFPFGFEGRIWDLIVSVPDHCLSFYFVV